MSAGCDASRRSSPSVLSIVGLALLVGLLGGLLFSIRDSVRVVLRDPAVAVRSSYSEMLGLGLYAAGRYALVGGAFMAVVGAGMALLVATGRAKLAGSRPLAWCAGVLAFLFLSVILLLRAAGEMGSTPGRLFWLAETFAVSALCALGAGVAAARLRERLAAWRRLLALAIAALAALFVVANWGLWLYLAVLPGHGKLAVRLGELAVVAVAALLAGGAYALVATRRRLGGVCLLVAAAAIFAVTHASLKAGKTSKPGPAAAPAVAAAKRPNILWIVMDTARADALSCYGYSRKTTPRIDALAAEGVLYERAIAPAPWTLPSHAAMFTGLLARACDTSAERQFLDDRFTTVAEVLAQHGYRTFGYSNNRYVAAKHNLAQGFEEFRAFAYGRTWRRNLLANQFHERLRLADYGARETNQVVRRWIRQCRAAGKPFFVFINYMEVHNDYGVTPEYRRWLPEGVTAEQALRVNQNIWAYSAGGVKMSQDDWRILRALYDGDATYLDARIGELAGFLRAQGILDDTLLIITSDHGEHFGEHGLGGHDFSLYDELVRVPLVIRYPAAFTPGRREASLVSLIDLFPTILEVAGIDWDGKGQLQGRSLLADAPPDGRGAVSENAMPLHVLHHVLDQHAPCDAARFLRRLKSIHAGDFKYIWASDGKDELYNVRGDPKERNDLIGQMPQKAAELKRQLEARLGHPLPPTHRAQDAPTP